MAEYHVYTWDMWRQEYTPQEGLTPGPFTRWGLRKAVRELRGMGYDGDRHDHNIWVERRCGDAADRTAKA